jgi:methionyl-tRNA formyltransferase
MSIVFFGTPRLAVPSLEYLIQAGEDVRAVVTQKDKRRTRRGEPVPSPVKESALRHDMPVLQPASMKDEGFLGELRGLEPEFIVVVAYGKILSQAVLDAPSVAPINLHASLLPRYRGASPIAWAIINGECETGLTTMFITRELDTGDIVLKERMEIREEDTTESVSLRMAERGGPLLAKTLDGLRDGSLRGIPQEGESTYAPLLTKEDGHMPWSKPSRKLYNFVRGMHPWPGAFTFLDGLRLRILRARASEEEGEPGVIRHVSKESFSVGCGKGMLEIQELQPEGKRAMSAAQFLSGHEVKAGMRLT